MTTKVTDYFIWYKDDVIPLDFCNHIIEKFKRSKIAKDFEKTFPDAKLIDIEED